MTRFAYAFAAVAVVAAVSGGMGALIVGQSTPTAPTAPTVGAVQTEWRPAVTTPADVAPAPVAQPVVTRTVTIVRHQSAAPRTPKAGKPVSTPDEPNGQGTEQVEQPAPVEPVRAVEPDPTPAPQLPSSDGMPTSMHGTPDPVLGGVSPGPLQTPPPYAP